MKKLIPLFLLIILVAVSGHASVFAQELKVQQVTPPASIKAIELKPGTAKNLPALFTVATKTHLFLSIAEDIHLSTEQKAKLEAVHQELEAHIEEMKSNYDKQNEGLHAILSKDHIELQQMRDNLHTAEEFKAEMQYFLFESLVKAANVLTPEQQLQIVQSLTVNDDIK